MQPAAAEDHGEQQPAAAEETGDEPPPECRIGLLLDLDAGSLSVYKNDVRLGAMVDGHGTGGRQPDEETAANDEVRIEADGPRRDDQVRTRWFFKVGPQPNQMSLDFVSLIGRYRDTWPNWAF